MVSIGSVCPACACTLGSVTLKSEHFIHLKLSEMLIVPTLTKGFISSSSAMVEGTVGCGGEAARICWHQASLSLIC